MEIDDLASVLGSGGAQGRKVGEGMWRSLRRIQTVGDREGEGKVDAEHMDGD